MSMVECPTYIQSDEKCGSHIERNACMKCGKTKEAHRVREQIFPSDQLAAEWLERAGYKGAPFFDLVRVVLTRYIEQERLNQKNSYS